MTYKPSEPYLTLGSSSVMAETLRTQGEAIKARIPLHRIGSPEDVAGAALYLSSRAGAYVNGATIALDGGSVVAMPAFTSAKL